MNKTDFRSCCPLSSSLELIGDKWSLLIVRDLLMGKNTYSEFLSSPKEYMQRIGGEFKFFPYPSSNKTFLSNLEVS